MEVIHAIAIGVGIRLRKPVIQSEEIAQSPCIRDAIAVRGLGEWKVIKPVLVCLGNEAMPLGEAETWSKWIA